MNAQRIPFLDHRAPLTCSCSHIQARSLSLLILPPPLGKVPVSGTGRLKVDPILMGQEAELLSHINPGSLCLGYLSLEVQESPGIWRLSDGNNLNFCLQKVGESISSLWAWKSSSGTKN